MHEYTFMGFFFSGQTLQYWLVESTDAEPRIWRANCKVISMLGFSAAQRGNTPNSQVVQNSTVYLLLFLIIKI